MTELLDIEIVYALPRRQELQSLRVPVGATVRQALDVSGLLRRYPEIDLAKNKVGIFGKLTRLDAPLGNHDRIEVYRPLLADPKEARRRRAVLARESTKNRFSTGVC